MEKLDVIVSFIAEHDGYQREQAARLGGTQADERTLIAPSSFPAAS
jgi:hypothetical protein